MAVVTLGARAARPGVLLCACLVLSGPPAHAFELRGSARLWLGETEAGETVVREENGEFFVDLSQELTPWLSVFGSFRGREFRSRFDLGEAFERSSYEPLIGLAYRRPTFTARLSFQDRAIRSSNEEQNLDSRTFLANLGWRPRRGPRWLMRYQDTTSSAVLTEFGRDTEAEDLDLRIDYSRLAWSARYSFGQTSLVNNTIGLDLEQTVHELRLGYATSLLDDKLSVAVDSRYAEIEQQETLPSGADVALPIPVREGLFAVDPTPELGTLESIPTLIDGDRATPAVPAIEIGGANTFRNIGVDLGITRPVDRIEIWVDRPSGGGLAWTVFESPDNVSWFPVAGIVSVFDVGFLHYSIRFPQRTNRFFKAVNVSLNAVEEVAVTEIRALSSVDREGRRQVDGNEYWVNFFSSAQPHERVEVAVSANLRRDQDIVGAAVQRRFDERSLMGQLRVDLTSRLNLRLAHRRSELDEDVEPVLQRDEEVSSAFLEWLPLSTVGVLLSATRREEREGMLLLNTSDTFILRATAELLTDLRLTSTIGTSETRDPAFGFDQTSWYWIESVDARPNDRWVLSGSVSHYSYDSSGVIVVTHRTNGQARAVWFATPFVSMNGEWAYSTDNLGDTASQRYGVQYAPGPKLSVAATYYETLAGGDTGTARATVDAGYRLNRWMRFWTTLSRSTTELGGQLGGRTTSFRLGLHVLF